MLILDRINLIDLERLKTGRDTKETHHNNDIRECMFSLKIFFEQIIYFFFTFSIYLRAIEVSEKHFINYSVVNKESNVEILKMIPFDMMNFFLTKIIFFFG
jgi:hypothetical protein